MSVLHYTNLLSVLISCTAEYRIIIADISKEVIRDGTTTIIINNIHQSYLIELFCSHAALLRVIYITIITPIMTFIDITITILIVLGNTVIIHSK
jgi:hypothetical protein